MVVVLYCHGESVTGYYTSEGDDLVEYPYIVLVPVYVSLNDAVTRVCVQQFLPVPSGVLVVLWWWTACL